MKKLVPFALAAALITFLGAPLHAQKDKNAPQTRTLTGAVMNKGEQPLEKALVYLKNTKTLAIKTYISQKDGTYRFPELALNVDYEIYAQKSGDKSKTKTLSQFDDRDKPNINLQIGAK